MRQEIALPTRDVSQAGASTTLGLSCLLALVTAAGFLWTARDTPLPAIEWAAAFLFVAVAYDVYALRIPNWLTFGALGAALVFAGVMGLSAFWEALGGAGLALAVLFLPFHVRWLGAGDVKAMMALGALWGSSHILGVLFWVVVSGGVLGLSWIALRGELPNLVSRWVDSLRVTFLSRQATYFPPAPGSVASGGLPFALAIGIGACCYQLWGSAWM
ncbi:MAG: prepilin peptidase [Myxococcota bacterium]